jgi:predicted DNA-binding transcriptional regulator AlpA
MSATDVLPSWFQPRGYKRELAAAYVGVGCSKFDEMVEDGRMPKPKRVDRRLVWDRYQLDQAFEELEGGDDAGQENEWDEVFG